MSVRYRTRSLPCKLFKSFLKKKKQNKTCTSLSNGSICIGNQIILVQFGINKQEEIFLKTNNLWSLKKSTSACLFQIAREQSCDYVLIIYMENYEMANHN